MRIGILSNTGKMNRQQIRMVLPYDFPWELISEDLIVLAGEQPWAKPDLEIFRFAVAQTGQMGNRSLYSSENLAETMAAQQAGMDAARLVLPGDAARLCSIVAPDSLSFAN